MFQDVFQAVSALAIAGGLVYAALQFRGWRTSQYVTNFTKIVELQLQLRKMVVDDPSLGAVTLSLPAGLSADEMRSYFYNLMQLSLFEIAWFAYSNGQLTGDYFASWVVNMTALSKRSTFRTMWENDNTKILHNGFREYMQKLMLEAAIHQPNVE